MDYRPEQLDQWESEAGREITTTYGLVQIASVEEHEQLVNLPNRLVIVETTKEGISAVKDIQRYFVNLAKENPEYIFCQYASEKLPSLAAKMNIFPVFKFFVNGQLLQQCYGGIELSLKTNFERAVVLYKKIMNPPKKKDLGSPEDLYSFGRKVVTDKGAKDETWVPENMRVAKLPSRALDDGAGDGVGATTRPPKAQAFANIDMESYAMGPSQPAQSQARIAAAPTFYSQQPQRVEVAPVQQQQTPQRRITNDNTPASPRAQPAAAAAQPRQAPAVQASVSVGNVGISAQVNVPQPMVGVGASDIPQLATICPGGEFVWALDVQGGVWRWNGVAFERIPGKLRSLAVGSDGAVWGTDHQDNIYRRTQNGWQQVRGRLRSIAVGNQNNVWGITPEGATVRYLGSGQWEPVTAFIITQ